MAPPDKARASGVSASSFLDLKAELAKQESEFAKNKGGQSKYVVGGTKRADKVSYGCRYLIILPYIADNYSY